MKNNVVEWAGPNQTAFFFPSFFPVFFFIYLFFWLRPFRFLLCLMIFAVASLACTFQPSCYIVGPENLVENHDYVDFCGEF